MAIFIGSAILLKAAAIAAKAGAVAAKAGAVVGKGAAVVGKGAAAGGKAVGGAAKVAGKKTISAAKVRGKKAVGSLKGRAKKIAKDKLLGRDKKKGRKFQRPQREGAEQQQQEQQQERGGELAVRPTTSLVPEGPAGISPGVGGALATTGDSGGAGGGNTAEEVASNISTKLVRVENLLKGSVALKKQRKKDLHKVKEEESDKAQEKQLESLKPPKDVKKGPKLNLPGKGILSRIFGFFGAIILGRIAFLAIDWLPKLMPVLKGLGAAADWIIDAGGMILNALAGFIEWGYKMYDAATGWIKNAMGEEGAKKFDIFMGNLKKLIQGFLVWKIIGEKIFKAIIASIKNTWKIIKGAFVKAFKFAKAALKAAWDLVKNLPGVKQGAQWLGRQAGRVGGFVKGLGSKILGGGAKAGGAIAGKVSGLAAKFLGPAAKGLGPVMKTVGPKIAKFAGRIPILGPIIVAVVSLMSGEPLGQALFKGLGAALGGALGATLAAALTTATVGIGALVAPALTILGEMIGTFVGDLLYELFMGGGMKEVMNRLKSLVKGIFDKVVDIGNWIAGGFKRFIENFFKETAIEIPKGGGRHSAMTLAAKALGMFDWLKEIDYVNSNDQVHKFPNVLQLYNPFKMIPLLKKSFFPPGGVKEEKEGKAPKKSEDSVGETESKKETGLGSPTPPEEVEVGAVPISNDKKNMLFAVNQATSYEEIVSAVRKFAPYEKPPEESQKSPNSVVGGGPQAPGSEGGETGLLVVGGGGNWKSDAFEALDCFG